MSKKSCSKVLNHQDHEKIMLKREQKLLEKITLKQLTKLQTLRLKRIFLIGEKQHKQLLNKNKKLSTKNRKL